MHIPDGFISDPVNTVTGVATMAALAYAGWRIKDETKLQPLLAPLFAVVATFVFAAHMLNFPIGGGTSGHFLGAVLAAALMGPWAACLALALVLFVQGAFFADGGLLAFGSNVFNMGVIGGIVSYYAMRGLRSVLPEGKGGFLASVGVASWLSIVLASTSCSLQLVLSGAAELGTILPAMVGTHAVIGAGEALIAVLAVAALTSAYPSLMPIWAKADSVSPSRVKAASLLTSGLAVSLLLAMLVSPLASSFPDGLEKVAEEQGIKSHAEAALWTGSPFADYQVAPLESESASTALAGLIGSLLVFAFAMVSTKGAARLRR